MKILTIFLVFNCEPKNIIYETKHPARPSPLHSFIIMVRRQKSIYALQCKLPLMNKVTPPTAGKKVIIFFVCVYRPIHYILLLRYHSLRKPYIWNMLNV